MKKLLLVIFILIFCNSYSFAEDYSCVVRVEDGDTIVLEGNKRIRLIGVDAPELHRYSLLYYAKEARDFTKGLCEGKKVKLKFDEANLKNNHIDKYGRTIAYVYLEDGTLVNAEIIKQGYGFYYVKYPFKYMDKFRRYQKKAMQSQRGLWPKLLGDPKTSKIIKYYEKLNDKGKEMAKDYWEHSAIRSKK